VFFILTLIRFRRNKHEGKRSLRGEPMSKIDPILTKMREICLSLPDTKETITWGQPHFRVGDKIFSGYGEEKGKKVIGFKLEMDHADAMLEDPRFWRAPYVGHKGWVSMDATQVRHWEEVRILVHESYRLIAPKKSLAKLGDGAPAPAPAAARTSAKKTVKKPSPTRRARGARSTPQARSSR
jgi:predicted DNA-binding protein (MmcQ/YjbR family)